MHTSIYLVKACHLGSLHTTLFKSQGREGRKRPVLGHSRSQICINTSKTKKISHQLFEKMGINLVLTATNTGLNRVWYKLVSAYTEVCNANRYASVACQKCPICTELHHTSKHLFFQKLQILSLGLHMKLMETKSQDSSEKWGEGLRKGFSPGGIIFICSATM